MRFSAQLMLWGSAIFSLVCLYIAWTGFSSLDGLTDPQVQSDSRGFAWFWLFLAAIGIASAAASWWMIRNNPEN